MTNINNNKNFKNIHLKIAYNYISIMRKYIKQYELRIFNNEISKKINTSNNNDSNK